MTRLLLLFALQFTFLVSGFAQFSLDKSKHEFGRIHEEDSLATVEFKLKNRSASNIKITSVEASCGCTKPSWSKESIAPGAESIINVSFVSWNRPGPFEKTITIKASTTPWTKKVKISGMVIPKPRTPELDYPAQIGSIRVKSKYLHVGNLTTQNPTTKSFKFYNASSDTLRFNTPVEAPHFLSVQIDPAIVPPGGFSNLNMIYDAAKKNDYGYVKDVIKFKSEEDSATIELYPYATIMEYFPAMSKAQMANEAVLTMDAINQDFGVVKRGNTSIKDLSFTNTGKKELFIRKISSNNPSLTAAADKASYKPGEKGVIKVSFDSSKRAGRQSLDIVVYCNDPSKPKRIVRFSASVVK